MTISNSISNGYKTFMRGADQLNADKLANRLVEAGYNTGAGRLGGVIAAGVGVGGSATATALIWDKMSPVETLFSEMPKAVAEQSGFAHQAVEVFGKVLEAGAETFILANTVNFGVQSIDSAIDMIKATKRQSLSLKDA